MRSTNTPMILLDAHDMGRLNQGMPLTIPTDHGALLVQREPTNTRSEQMRAYWRKRKAAKPARGSKG